MKPISLFTLIILLAFTVACGSAPTPVAQAPAVATSTAAVEPTTAPAAAAPTSNMQDGCVETYDPAVDYFPEKADVQDASGWSIEYFNNYKLVEVLTPWQGADTTFTYALVQCGTPAPEGFDEAQIIEVPIKSVIAMSTTQLPHLVTLGKLDTLVALDSGLYVNTPEVRDRVDAGKLAEIGNGAEVNVERALDLEPDVIMTYGSGDPQYDAQPKLTEAGLHVVINADYMEQIPLGRAEWLKFTAAFYNSEATAQAAFADVSTQYNDLAAQVVNVGDAPTVLMDAPYQGAWYLPGGNSFQARYVTDAGANYLWSDNTDTGSQELDFEAVFERAANADYWINVSAFTSVAEMLADDERFARFAPVKNGNVYNNNARVNENGGNDVFENGVANPQIVLADLVKIFHPELLPDHKLYFYQQLKP